MGALRKIAKPGLLCLVSFLGLGVTSCHHPKETLPAPQENIQPAAKPLTRVETSQEKSCREFVQGFYDWYFARLNLADRQNSASTQYDDVIRFRPETLTPRLRQMLKDDMDASSGDHDEIVGIDFDPYIGAQDWEGQYWARGVTLKNSVCRASVWGTDAGKKTEIVDPELDFAANKWVFVNFHYPNSLSAQDENLVDILNGLRVDRKQRRM